MRGRCEEREVKFREDSRKERTCSEQGRSYLRGLGLESIETVPWPRCLGISIARSSHFDVQTHKGPIEGSKSEHRLTLSGVKIHLTPFDGTVDLRVELSLPTAEAAFSIRLMVTGAWRGIYLRGRTDRRLASVHSTSKGPDLLVRR